MAASPLSPLQPGLEMFERNSVQQPFFKARTYVPRPASVASDMYETEFEEDLEEDEGSNSPHTSIESFGKKSDTTLSSYDELSTPTSNQYAGFDFQLGNGKKSVEGPKGPHLFRASQDSSSQEYTFHLSMSPLTPKDPTPRPATAFQMRTIRPPPVPVTAPASNRPLSTLTEAVARLETAEVRNWTPRQVAAWMHDAGFEAAVVDKFEGNDISGAILVDLKFEDLKELDIKSFGKRHKLWTEIHNLRPSPLSSPLDSSRPSSHDRQRRRRQHGDCSPEEDEEEEEEQSRRDRSYRQNRRALSEDHIISPAESVSIVGIEQLIPKPHKCSKGERCAKFRRQQRQLALLAQDHPVSPERGGAIVISGDPGNASTAGSALRPVSDAVPSVVASSDVLGPGQVPTMRRLEEHSLRTVQHRDPQENVKRFLDFQHLQEPPTPAAGPLGSPPLEMFPPLQSPAALKREQPIHDHLRSLPRLAIPPPRAATSFSPTRTITPSNVYRRGTPCSEMDVPVTAVPLGPVARDVSQSVPPDMRYRRGSVGRRPSMGGRRSDSQPSFAMTKVDENTIWSPSGAELAAHNTINPNPSSVSNKYPGATHAGYMKKRKTKFLRHEWQEHHFRLQGTRLAMHHDARSLDELEHIDVDDYAVACSSLASSNKLSAALKSIKISTASSSKAGGGADDAKAFAFQLVPAGEKKHAGVHKSGAHTHSVAGHSSGGAGAAAKSHAAATGKTHHFAVKTRDQRIDWMRELMLAKALKQKGEGFEMTVNGNMI